MLIKAEKWALFIQSAVVFDRCYLIEDGEKAMDILKQVAMKYYLNEEIAIAAIIKVGKATQIFEIKIEQSSGKEIQENNTR